jgi:sortase A
MRTVGRHQDMARFRAMVELGPATAAPEPDMSLWAPERVEAWRATLSTTTPPPLGILRIPKIGLEVPILEGVDNWTLNRAVGYIGGTALPGMPGNSGLAGHRDGYFRGLKDIQPGDTLEIETTQGAGVYRVDHTWIVEPSDVSVLDPTPTPAVTLVTCYPFYFIGHAPQRFIVRAVLEPPSPVGETTLGPKSH